VSHKLGPAYKRQRAKLSEDLVKTVSPGQRYLWHHFVTDHEILFYLPTDCEIIWIHEGEKQFKREKKIVSAKKVTLPIFWSPAGIYMIDKPSNSEPFNSQHFRQSVLSKVDANPRSAGISEPVLIHMKAISRHRSKKTPTI
jgi:hypothetical protein